MDQEPEHRKEHRALPTLVHEQLRPANWVGDEIDLQLCAAKNWPVLRALVSRNAPEDRSELAKRVTDKSLPWDLRALYAGVLACQEQSTGQEFLAAAAKERPSQRLADTFWLIGNLSFLMPADVATAKPNLSVLQEDRNVGTVKFVPRVQSKARLRPDLAWAIPTMLLAISDRAVCRQKLTWTDVCNRADGRNRAYPEQRVRELALHYGGFHRLLTQLRCDKAVPLFCEYVLSVPDNEAVAAPGPALVTPSAANEILSFLTTWDTPQVERTLLEAAHRAEKVEWGGTQVALVLPWFLQRKKPEAIPLILNSLEEMDVYSAVVGTKHPPYLQALRNRLPKLQDEKLQGPMLARRRSERHHAELILIIGEQVDPVPKLMQFAANPENEYERTLAVYQLNGRKDTRIVRWANESIRQEHDWFQPFVLIRLLGSLPDENSDRVLVELLDWDFRTVKPDEENLGSAKAYHAEIIKALENKTGKHFGPDPAKWRDWLKSRPSAAKQPD
jgi:hypothetical protein